MLKKFPWWAYNFAFLFHCSFSNSFFWSDQNTQKMKKEKEYRLTAALRLPPHNQSNSNVRLDCWKNCSVNPKTSHSKSQILFFFRLLCSTQSSQEMFQCWKDQRQGGHVCLVPGGDWTLAVCDDRACTHNRPMGEVFHFLLLKSSKQEQEEMLREINTQILLWFETRGISLKAIAHVQALPCVKWVHQ